MRWMLLAVVLAGCGRIRFDEHASSLGGGHGDAGNDARASDGGRGEDGGIDGARPGDAGPPDGHDDGGRPDDVGPDGAPPGDDASEDASTDAVDDASTDAMDDASMDSSGDASSDAGDSGPPPEIPMITTTASHFGRIGLIYRYDADAVGEPPLMWILVTGPSGMTIDATTGYVEWITTMVGTFPVHVRVVDPDGEADDEMFDLVVTSGGVFNGLAPAALTTHRDALIALAARPLDVTALPRSPDAQLLATDVEECARTFAPAWIDRACDAACREIVSACLLAHLNPDGERVPIELGAEGSIEAQYFGDVFAGDWFACVGDRAAAPSRRCAQGECGVISIGACDGACEGDHCRAAWRTYRALGVRSR